MGCKDRVAASLWWSEGEGGEEDIVGLTVLAQKCDTSIAGTANGPVCGSSEDRHIVIVRASTAIVRRTPRYGRGKGKERDQD